MERLPSDGERTLRVGGYVARCVKGRETTRAAEPAPEPEKAGITWPNISDYWPDTPQRQEAAPAWTGYFDQGSGPVDPGVRMIGEPPESPRRRRLRTALGVVVAVLTVTACGVIVARLSDRPAVPADLAAGTSQPPATAPGAVLPSVPETVLPSLPAEAEPEPTLTPSRTPSRKPTATAAPAEPPLENAAFELVDGVTELSVRTTELDEPFEVSTPRDSGLKVRPAFSDGVLRVRATPTGEGGNGRVEVLLSDDVTWRLRMTGGVARASFDLASRTVRRIDLTGGAAEINMRLGRQGATVPIRMSGGVSAWNIRTSARVPVRVVARRGGSRVDLYGRVTEDLAAGTTVRSGDLDDGRGLDLDAEGGFSALTVSEVR